MRALTYQELEIVTGGQSSGGGGTQGGGGGTQGGGGSQGNGGSQGGGGQQDRYNVEVNWDEDWNGSRHYDTYSVEVTDESTGISVEVGTLDDPAAPGNHNGGQITVTIPFGR